MPGGAHRPAAKAVGLVVVEELFLGWVPLQGSLELVRDDCQVSQRCGALPDFLVAARLLVGPNALEPVGVMVVLADIDLPCLEFHLLEDFFRAALNGPTG